LRRTITQSSVNTPIDNVRATRHRHIN